MNDNKKVPILPVEAYTSQQWFNEEQKKIFSTVWRYAGFVEDIPQPGEYITVQVGLNNIIILMGRDWRLRAFHNLCRHKGTRLLRAVGNTQKAITCPYHDWTYDLEGNLVSIPEQEQEFKNVNKSCLGLKKATVDTWKGMIFVHPEPDAGSIMEWFGDVEPYLGPHVIEDLIEYPNTKITEEIKANWKIVVENYIDVYHLSHLHSGTLSMYDHAKAEFEFIGPHYAFREPLSENYQKNIEKNSPMPLILPLDNLAAWVPMLFPGLGLSATESSWSTFSITPLAPDLTKVEIRTRLKKTSEWEFSKQEMKSYNYWSNQIRGKYSEKNTKGNNDPLLSADFMAEDIYVCEQQQKSFSSPYFEIGASAEKGESPVRQHQQIVKKYMETHNE